MLSIGALEQVRPSNRYLLFLHLSVGMTWEPSIIQFNMLVIARVWIFTQTNDMHCTKGLLFLLE